MAKFINYISWLDSPWAALDPIELKCAINFFPGLLAQLREEVLNGKRASVPQCPRSGVHHSQRTAVFRGRRTTVQHCRRRRVHHRWGRGQLHSSLGFCRYVLQRRVLDTKQRIFSKNDPVNCLNTNQVYGDLNFTLSWRILSDYLRLWLLFGKIVTSFSLLSGHNVSIGA